MFQISERNIVIINFEISGFFFGQRIKNRFGIRIYRYTENLNLNFFNLLIPIFKLIKLFLISINKIAYIHMFLTNKYI